MLRFFVLFSTHTEWRKDSRHGKGRRINAKSGVVNNNLYHPLLDPLSGQAKTLGSNIISPTASLLPFEWSVLALWGGPKCESPSADGEIL